MTQTKMDIIRRLISRRHGASVDELTEATGWIAHSLTGAISRLKSSGLNVARMTTPNRGVVYKVLKSNGGEAKSSKAA